MRKCKIPVSQGTFGIKHKWTALDKDFYVVLINVKKDLVIKGHINQLDIKVLDPSMGTVHFIWRNYDDFLYEDCECITG